MSDDVRVLKQAIKQLTEELEELKEENGSLWDMLGVIKESDRALKKELDKYQDDILIEMLSEQKPIGEA